MTHKLNIENRRPVWIALSAFYLDTELEEADFRKIASTILDSPFSVDGVKAINKYEVFPILYTNLLNVAGVWSGFDEDWLIEKITSRLTNKTKFNDIAVEIKYQMFKWMYREYWKKLEGIYTGIK